MSDGRFTKIAAGLLTDVRHLVDWGIEGGHTTGDELRYSVQARKKVVRQLRDQGFSQRQIANAVGASQMTVHRDLTGSKPEPNVSNYEPNGTRTAQTLSEKALAIVKQMTPHERKEFLELVMEMDDNGY